MSRRTAILAALLIVTALFKSLPLAAAALAAESTSTPGQIGRWIDELASESFVTREDATQALIGAGEAVIEPLTAALADADAETAVRGVFVLRELALSGDEALETKARDALVLIAHGRSRSAASKATATVARIDEVRQERALAALDRLGADVQHDAQIQIDLRIEFVRTWVYIGADFRGTDEDLKQLRWLGNVQALTLEGERITNNSLPGVAGMKELMKLEIKRAKVTHVGLAAAADLPKLAELDVFYTPIDDGAVPHLQRMKTAEVLKLYGTKMTSKAAEKLQLALAGTRVDLRQGAFLGIGCGPHELGCIVTQVRIGTAAAEADLRPGDVITHYSDRKVEDFEQLTQMIGENVPGDSVMLSVWRDGGKLTKKVKLGEWE
jgi:hypothetical protein